EHRVPRLEGRVAVPAGRGQRDANWIERADRGGRLVRPARYADDGVHLPDAHHDGDPAGHRPVPDGPELDGDPDLDSDADVVSDPHHDGDAYHDGQPDTNRHRYGQPHGVAFGH